MLEFTHCRVDLERRCVCRRSDGQLSPLTSREAALLVYLSARPGEVVGRDVLAAEVWRYARGVNSRAMDNTVARLRAKIEANPARPDHLLTEYGTGYRLVVARRVPTAAADVDVARDAAASPPLLVLDGVQVDLVTGQVFGARDQPLQGVELGLLRELAASPGRRIDWFELERKVWGGVSDRRGRVHNAVNRLRAKVERDPAQPRHILVVRGHGYQFAPLPAAPESGEVTVVVASVDDGAEGPDQLWAAAVGAAAGNGGYASGVANGRACVVFGDPDAAARASRDLTRRLGGARIGIATGPARRCTNPVSGRFEYLGPALARAEELCLRSSPAPWGQRVAA